MHWWQDTKKAVIVRQLGTGKRLRLRLVRLGKFSLRQNDRTVNGSPWAMAFALSVLNISRK
ncbi:hypothetical protein, partial [Bilophila wadsworthia]|uniref:hypothetical protein n=1 Tax=Bilophila wadsworthia TaxID=35833 RepID=UPI003AAF2C6C